MTKYDKNIIGSEDGKVLYKKWHRAKVNGCCPEWVDNFMAFYKWAIDGGYKYGLSLFRIDNDKPYSPDNCVWVDGQKEYMNHCQIAWAKEWNKTVNRIRVAYGMEPFKE